MTLNLGAVQADRLEDERTLRLFRRFNHRFCVIDQNDIYGLGYATGPTAWPQVARQFSGGSIPYERSQVDEWVSLMVSFRAETCFFEGALAMPRWQSTATSSPLVSSPIASLGACHRQLTPAEIQMLCVYFTVQDSAKVIDFVERHPFLVSLLIEARGAVREYFPGSAVALKVVRHRQVEGWEQLFANIVTTLSVDEALAQLRRLDYEWFLDQLDRAGDLFNFDLEFV